jgi:hypothetical protein
MEIAVKVLIVKQINTVEKVNALTLRKLASLVIIKMNVEEYQHATIMMELLSLEYAGSI